MKSRSRNSAHLATRAEINPALLYWQGFAALPHLIDAERRCLQGAATLSQNRSEVVKLTRRFDATLEFVRRARLMSGPCDWGIDFAQGPRTRLDGLAKARLTVQAAIFRSRIALEEGHSADAVEDLLSAFILARRVAQPGSLIHFGVQLASERDIIQCVAAEFHRLPNERLRELMTGMGAAPQRLTCAEAVERDRENSYEWILEVTEGILSSDLPGPAQVEEWLDQLDIWNSEPAREDFRAAIGNSIRGASQLLRDIEPGWDLAHAVANANDRQVIAARDALDAFFLRSRNPFQFIIPEGVYLARIAELAHTAHPAMLRAALAWRENAEEGFVQVSDPFGTGPFQMRFFTGNDGGSGFELSTCLQDQPQTEHERSLRFVEWPRF